MSTPAAPPPYSPVTGESPIPEVTTPPDSVNEHGTPVSNHVCETCGGHFSVCPAVPVERRDEWRNCMGDLCPSYDIDRDPTYLFLPDEPELREATR